MDDNDIIRNLINRRGQCQDGRMPEELGVHFADVDERTPADRLMFVREFARLVNHYRDGITEPSGDWSPFFAYDDETAASLIDEKAGDVDSHTALMTAFLKLLERPREIMNRFTGSHLDFYYSRVLGFGKRPPLPDRAHALVELKKKSLPVKLGPGNVFTAGKDKDGTELLYSPVRDTVVNLARVDSLRSVFLDGSCGGTVRYATKADSSDGKGGKLPAPGSAWYAFGHEDLPEARVGFALSSPVLRMKEGNRAVTVSLTLRGGGQGMPDEDMFVSAFEAYVTGEKGWLGPYPMTGVNLTGGRLEFTVTVHDGEKAVVDYSPKKHGEGYDAAAPLLRVVMIESDKRGRTGYSNFRGMSITGASINVDVSGIRSLELENDYGTLNPKKAFMPFGPQPVKHSRFIVGYSEAFSKDLSEVNIIVGWKGLPDTGFRTHYSNYKTKVNNYSFTASVSFSDGAGWNFSRRGEHLFNTKDIHSERPFKFAELTKESSHSGLYFINKRTAKTAHGETAVEGARASFVTFSLEADFLHAEYREMFAYWAFKNSKLGSSSTPTIIKEPYTPEIATISLSYKAEAEANIGSDRQEDFDGEDIRFFHVSCFGQRREHGYLLAKAGRKNAPVRLLPQFDNEGELIIGFSGLKPGDGVSVLFQTAEGTEDPSLHSRDLDWCVLCDNRWQRLGQDRIALDTTNRMLASGIVHFLIPPYATDDNTLLPPGSIWVKAAVREHVRAVCRLKEVSANAVELSRVGSGGDQARAAATLEAGRITTLKTSLPEVKSVRQPYSSFGGRAAEADEDYFARVSERLRHKGRCSTPWDYERTVLDAFPEIHQVKCIPHSRECCWLAPGHLMLVVVPSLRGGNASQPLQPRVDADTLDRITSYVEQKSSPLLKDRITVKNPEYRKVRLDFNVRFREGFEFTFYRKELDTALVQFLSPWAYEAGRDVVFGGGVYKSVILDFVEELEYVDYVTEFRMYAYSAGQVNNVDVPEVSPASPDEIVVSEDGHSINEA